MILDVPHYLTDTPTHAPTDVAADLATECLMYTVVSLLPENQTGMNEYCKVQHLDTT